MSFPFFNLPPVATARARRRSGLGFAQGDDSGGDSYDLWGDYDYLFDYGGNYGGGGGYDLPFYGVPDWSGLGPAPSPSANDYRYDYDWEQQILDYLSGDPFSPMNTFSQGAGGQQPSYRDITGNLDYQNNLWDWLTNILGSGSASADPQYGPAGTGQGLPRYCPPGTGKTTVNGVSDDKCYPFDVIQKKQASSQQKAQQAAASAAKKAQQQQDKTCPKDPQNRPVWRNPQTGKCELVPQCPAGSTFDSTTKRCLTAAQAKEIYGGNNWLLWLLIAAGALVIINSGGSSSGGRRRR